MVEKIAKPYGNLVQSVFVKDTCRDAKEKHTNRQNQRPAEDVSIAEMRVNKLPENRTIIGPEEDILMEEKYIHRHASQVVDRFVCKLLFAEHVEKAEGQQELEGIRNPVPNKKLIMKHRYP